MPPSTIVVCFSIDRAAFCFGQRLFDSASAQIEPYSAYAQIDLSSVPAQIELFSALVPKEIFCASTQIRVAFCFNSCSLFRLGQELVSVLACECLLSVQQHPSQKLQPVLVLTVEARRLVHNTIASFYISHFQYKPPSSASIPDINHPRY